jgi:hypothetical protein
MCSGSKRILTIGLLLSFLFCSVTFIPGSGNCQSINANPGLPTVTIDLVQDSQTAEVGPGDDGVVEFDGVVNVTRPPGTRVVVSLTAEDTWGSAVASPSSILFSNDGQQGFEVKIRAPSKESCESVGEVKVFGKWTLYPGGLSGPAEPQEGAPGTIYIAQYYKYTLSGSKTFIETTPGAEEEFDLTIENRGNGEDSFSVSIINSDELSKKDIQVKLSVSQVELDEKQNMPIKVDVELPSGAKVIDYHSIRVQVVSNNGMQEGLPPQSFTFVIRVPDDDLFATTEFSMFLNIFVIILIVVFVVLFWRWHKKRGSED